MVRVFTDKRGETWSVWAIQPYSHHFLLGGPNYTSEHCRLGCLSFQTIWGTRQRLLSPIPADWESLSDAELIDLLERATAVPLSRAER